MYKEVGKNPELKKIKNNLQEFEQILGGKIACIPYENIIIVCKENRKNLQPNIYINTKFLGLGETVRGNIIITAKDEQNFKTLRKEQVIENIRFLRNSIAQKSLRIFAYENDIPCATLSRIENGIRIPNLLILRKIAAGLNFDLSTLISKVEENIPEDLKGFDI